jgi:NAD(P)-dependent dehydrogenase (short-subunit alcohol dehydrogenase family)
MRPGVYGILYLDQNMNFPKTIVTRNILCARFFRSDNEADIIATNSVAVITGGCGGMGIACARRLGKHHTLLLADIDARRLDTAAGALSADGYTVNTTAGDLMEPEVIAALAEKARSLGRLGALVHTAGLSPTMAGGRRVLEFNIAATARIERAFLPLAEPGTAAVLIASTAGHMDRFGDKHDAILRDPLAADFWDRLAEDAAGSENAYIISKRGVIRYAEQVAAEWGARGARIVSISPGTIATPMGRLEFDNQPLMKPMLDMTPIQRWGDPDDIAAAVEFLCSADAVYITGTDLRVDGGITARLRGQA